MELVLEQLLKLVVVVAVVVAMFDVELANHNWKEWPRPLELAVELGIALVVAPNTELAVEPNTGYIDQQKQQQQKRVNNRQWAPNHTLGLVDSIVVAIDYMLGPM